MDDKVQVKATVTETVTETISGPIARQLCEDFLEWLESQGLEIQVKAGRKTDDRGYDELAHDFIVEYS